MTSTNKYEELNNVQFNNPKRYFWDILKAALQVKIINIAEAFKCRNSYEYTNVQLMEEISVYLYKRFSPADALEYILKTSSEVVLIYAKNTYDWKDNITFEDKKEVLEEFLFMEQYHLGINCEDDKEILLVRELSGPRRIIYDYDNDILVIDKRVVERSYVESCMLLLRELRHQYQWKFINCGIDWHEVKKNSRLDFILKANRWSDEHYRCYRNLGEFDEYPSNVVYAEDDSFYELAIVKDVREYVSRRLYEFGWDEKLMLMI